MKAVQPEVESLAAFLAEFNRESDRGAALVAASMLDERLCEVLGSFLTDGSTASELLSGFNAPLGTLSARASASHALGLIQDNEFAEITIIRKIRNEFGHSWKPMSLETGKLADLTRQLPWLGPEEMETSSSLRSRFNFAVAILLTDLMWRVKLVQKERRTQRLWPNKARHS
jgi:hypothetical protein